MTVRSETVDEIQWIEQTEAPTEPGTSRYVNGALQFRDASGVFDPREGSDEKARVSSNDTTSGYLNGKLVAGDGIEFTEQGDGGDETLEIKATGGASEDEKVAVSANDTTPGYLDSKLAPGDYVALTEQNDGGNESVLIESDDERVKVSANDTDEGYLADKLVAGPGIALAEQDDGADESLRVAVGKMICLSWASGLAAYVYTYSKTAWDVMAQWVFPGTAHMQAGLTSIKFVGWTSNAAKTAEVRIYDVTNDEVIAGPYEINDEDPTLIDIGTLANVPTGPAIWEFQGMVAGNPSPAIYAASLSMFFEV